MALRSTLICAIACLSSLQAIARDPADAAVATVETTSAWMQGLDAAEVDGVAASKWTERWWRWVHAFPPGLLPYQDRDGRRCTIGQEGRVWFLAGTDGSFDARRTCRVPKDVWLLVPVINMIHLGPAHGGRSCAALKAAAATNNDHLRSAVAILDGDALPSRAVRRLRVDGCFNLLPSHHGIDGTRAAADGYWLLLPPLSPGRHVLSVGANYGAPGSAYGAMVQNFEYTLEVGGPEI